MRVLIVFCGIPASGKTTTSQEASKQYHAKLYCFDEYKIEARKLSGKTSHERMYSEIIQDLLAGHDVILDDLHTRLEWRQDLLDAIQEVPCKKILVVMTTPLEECVRRNSQRQDGKLSDSVIYHLYSRYQPPSLEEGWDDILYF